MRRWTHVQARDAERRQVVLRPTGEVDMSTADALEAALLDAVRQAGVGEVVVDLGDVGFLDSSGVRVLVHGVAVAREHDVTLRVTRPQPVVARVLRITSVDTLLGLADGDSGRSADGDSGRPAGGGWRGLH
ncbi:STAS domain-containing protein [Micromonospora sp. LZ34]